MQLVDFIGLTGINCIGYCNDQTSNLIPGKRSLQQTLEEHGWKCSKTDLHSNDCPGEIATHDIMALYIYVKGKYVIEDLTIQEKGLHNASEATEIIKGLHIHSMYSQEGIWDLDVREREHNNFYMEISQYDSDIKFMSLHGEDTTSIKREASEMKDKLYAGFSLQSRLNFDFHGTIKTCKENGTTMWKFVSHYYAQKFKSADEYYKRNKNFANEDAENRKKYFDAKVGVPVIEINDLHPLNSPLTYEKYCCSRKKQ